MRYGWGILIGVLLAATSPALAQTAAPSTSPNPNAGVKTALETCFKCHGPGGVSLIPSHPSIAGQNADYVARQLFAFKRASALHASAGDAVSGDKAIRSDPIMEHMAATSDDALVGRVAVAVSQLACRADDKVLKTPKAPAVASRCASCHGENGRGVRSEVPNLAGQQRAYLRRELLLIRETAWGAEPRDGESWRGHPIMEAEAARLKIADVDALAKYYSALDCRG